MRLKVKVRPKDPNAEMFGFAFFDNAATVLDKFRYSLVVVQDDGREMVLALFVGWGDALYAAQMFWQYKLDQAAKNPEAGQTWRRKHGGTLVKVTNIYYHEGNRWVQWAYVSSGKEDETPFDRFIATYRPEKLA